MNSFRRIAINQRGRRRETKDNESGTNSQEPGAAIFLRWAVLDEAPSPPTPAVPFDSVQLFHGSRLLRAGSN